MKIISPKISTTAWVDLFAISGVDPKYAHVIENVSEIGIRLALNGETLAERPNCILLNPNEEFFIQPNWGIASVIAEGNAPGRISIRRAESTDIKSALRKVVGLSDPRVLTQTLSQIEVASIEGRLFHCTVDISIPAGSSSWFSFQSPVDKECAFTDWVFSPFYTGFEARVITGATGGVLSTTYPNRSSNLKYNPSTATFRSLTGTPTGGSIFFIPVFIPASAGNNNNRDRGINSVSTGYKIIPANSGFQIELINTSGNANRLIMTLTWLEAPASVLSS